MTMLENTKNNEINSELNKLHKVKFYSLINLLLSILSIAPVIMLFAAIPSMTTSGTSGLLIASIVLLIIFGIASTVLFVFWITWIVSLKKYEHRRKILVFAWLSLLGISIITSSICFLLCKSAILEWNSCKWDTTKNDINDNIDDNKYLTDRKNKK